MQIIGSAILTLIIYTALVSPVVLFYEGYYLGAAAMLFAVTAIIFTSLNKGYDEEIDDYMKKRGRK